VDNYYEVGKFQSVRTRAGTKQSKNLKHQSTERLIESEIQSIISSTTITTNQQPNINSSTIDKLTDEAKLFAQTRYPFSPFTLRFSTPHIHEQKITDELCKILKENNQLELELCGYRKASTRCSSNECDLLLFVKNSYSFSILLDENNWPPVA